jgi:ABC-2 type transport system permease protein
LLLSRYTFAKYLLFFNTNLEMYDNGTPIIEGMTLGFSIFIIIGYMIAILALSFYVFKKRDVA